MSNKNKDKKPQELLELQKKVDTLTHENLQLSIQTKKLQQTSIIAKKELQMVQKQSNTAHQQKDKKIQQLELVNLSLSQRLAQIRQEREQFEIQNECLKYKLEKLEKSFDQFKATKERQSEEYKKYVTSELTKYETIVNDYHGAINERLKYLAHNQDLKKKIQQQNVEYTKVLADKDRDKIQAIDELKKEMLQKSRQMRANLLSMRRQQMATNTRLTVLQNQQLLQQLEYQSKNTEKIIKKNLDLESKVKQLSKQLQIQKQIEKQLATRTTISKKIIKSLNQKNNLLQAQIKRQSIVQTRSSQAQSILKKQIPAQNLTNEYTKTVQLLHEQLLKYQNQLKKLQKQKLHFQQLYQTFQPQYEFYLNNQNDLRTLMIKFYQNLLQGKVIGEQNEIVYDISRLKNVHISQWSKSDMQTTIKMLLTFLKPHFIMKNMKSSFLKGKQHFTIASTISDYLPQIKNMTQKTAQKKFKSKSLSNHYTKLLKFSNEKANIDENNCNNLSKKTKGKRDLSLHASTNVTSALKPDIQMKKSIQKTKSQHNLSKQQKSIKQQISQNDDNKNSKCSNLPFRQWGSKVKLLKEIPINANFNLKSFSKIQKKSKLLSSHVKFHHGSSVSQKNL